MRSKNITNKRACLWSLATKCADHLRRRRDKTVEYYTNITLIRMFTNVQRHVMIVISYFYSIGCRIVNWVTADGCVHIAESVGSRRELVANSCTHRRVVDATQLDSFVASASAVCIGLYSAAVHATTVPVTAAAANNKSVTIFIVIYLEKYLRLQPTSRK